jgi:5-methylcytosine-specific restriction enzyme A
MKINFGYVNTLVKKHLESINPEFRKPVTKRNSDWTALSKRMILQAGNKCCLCRKSDNLITHHIVPVHIDKALELDESNLIVLCENLTHNCHFIFGHLLNWRSYNISIEEDVEIWREKIIKRLS